MAAVPRPLVVALLAGAFAAAHTQAPLFYSNLLRTSAATAGYLTAVVSGQELPAAPLLYLSNARLASRVSVMSEP